jgi:hypothetical protein
MNFGRKPHSKDLGPCCTCNLKPATTVVFVNERAPIDGTGWGCLRCGIPPNGAVSVICEDCKKKQIPIKKVCVGKPAEGRRALLEMTTGEKFDHDYSKHPEIRKKENTDERK